MSTILKALRRIEEEKTGSGVRPLREDVVFSPARPPARVAPWIVSAVVLGAAAALLFWSLRREGPLLPVGAAPSPVATAPPPAVTPAPAPAPAPAAPAPVAAAPPMQRVAPAPPVAVLPSTASEPAFEESELTLPDGEAFEVIRPIPPRPVRIREFAPATPPTPVPPPRSTLRSETPPPPRFQEPPAREPAREPKLAVVGEPPAARAAARSANAPRVVRTQWHPSPARRSAWVAFEGGGAREVHEGDRVGSLVVREIDPDGVRFADGAAELRSAVAP